MEDPIDSVGTNVQVSTSLVVLNPLKIDPIA